MICYASSLPTEPCPVTATIMWMLGGEIIRRRHEDAELYKQSVKVLLFNLIEEDGGSLIWPRISESQQNAFDATCRKLYRFLQQDEIP